MASEAIYIEVIEQLERDQVRYVIVGGVAVVLHGHVRPIADLDLVIDPAPVEADRAVRALTAVGFVPTIPLPITMLTVLRMLDQNHRELDIFIRYHIPFDELWRDSVRLPFGGRVANVASFDHVLREKRYNGRPDDLRDMEALLALKNQAS